MNKRFLYFSIAILLILTSIIIGCADSNARTTQNNQPQITYTALQETLITTTATPANTPTLVPLPTQTYIATLDAVDINLMISSLFNKCRLPCWGQIIPGSTSEISAIKFLSSFGGFGTKSVSFQYQNKPVVIDLTFKNGMVNSINLPPEITEFIMITTLLSEYGSPEDVRLEVIPETADGKPWFNLALLYPKQGFFAIFSGEGLNVAQKINICPENISPDLYLFQSNTYSLSEMNDIVFLILQQRLMPLETLTDVDISKFIEFFHTETGKCIPTNIVSS